MPMNSLKTRSSLGCWKSGGAPAATDVAAMRDALHRINEPVYALDKGGSFALGLGGTAVLGPGAGDGLPVLAFAPSTRMENLGDPSFCSDHGVRFPYVAGSMANGISSVELVEAMAGAGLLGFFGAAGLAPSEVEKAIDRLLGGLGGAAFGCNLIHSPAEPQLEEEIADLYIRKGVRLVEAAAYIDLTPAIVRYRVHGIHRGPSGEIDAPNSVIAKVSRVEVGAKFFAPPPPKLLAELVRRGQITDEQAKLASELPMARDLTAEADSAGHTDNRSMVDLLPIMTALRDRARAEHGFEGPMRVGAAGGISTPAAAAAAFSMGAAYVVVGSVHQSCVESGTSDPVRQLLAQAGQADVTMAPAADMFEMGVKVQVLKRGTMFAMRAARLYETYRNYDGIEAIPPAVRAKLEAELFRAPLDTVWDRTREYFLRRDPEQVTQADRDPKHKMALTFRWYLGRASRWANAGDPSRRVDYQVWCGPAMGTFNEWVKGTFLEDRGSRRAATVARNLLFGAAVQQRISMLRGQGAAPPDAAARVAPLEPEKIEEYLR